MSSGERPPAAARLDCRGLLCPLPALETRKALQSLAGGEIVEVTCTDPASQIDIPALCDQTGDRIVESRADDGLFVFWIARRAHSIPAR